MAEAGAPVDRYWKVIGGGDKGGIIVRCGQDMSCSQAAQRLATGAVVREVQCVGERLEYKLLQGDGPQQGWVSLAFKGNALVESCEKPDPFAALAGLKELCDLSWEGELEVKEIEVGTEGFKAKASVRCRPEGSPKAPVSVLMLPGNPVVNSYTADQPLPLTVDEAFGRAGFPVVRFDWMGVGMNEGDGSYPKHQDYVDKIPLTYMMYEVAKSMGDRVALCSWNFSGTIVTTTNYTKEPDKMMIETLPEVCAVVSLSFAYKQWEFVKRFVNEQAGYYLKAEFEAHNKLTVPAFYCFGSKDVHTPADELQALLDTRPDGGKGAEMYVVDQGDQKMNNTYYFMMKDKEGEAAIQCAKWLSKIRFGLELGGDSAVMGG